MFKQIGSVASYYPLSKLEFDYYKQVCVYGFKPEALKFFCDYGETYGKGKVEAVEDIEILRFIENGYEVQYIEVDSETVAVDTPNDLEKVRKSSENIQKTRETEVSRVLVTHRGFEPRTPCLKGRCSAD